MRAISTLLLGCGVIASASPLCAQEVNWQKVDEAFGRKAAAAAGTCMATALREPT
jgi:hypothetical protein